MLYDRIKDALASLLYAIAVVVVGFLTLFVPLILLYVVAHFIIKFW